jgi:uncharacterized membrane protein YfcA
MSTWNKAAFVFAIGAFLLAVFGNEFLPRDGLFWSSWKLLVLLPVLSMVLLLAVAALIDRQRAKTRQPEAVYTSFMQLVVMLGFVALLVSVLIVPALNRVLDKSASHRREALCVDRR